METNIDLHHPLNTTYKPNPNLYFQRERYSDEIEDADGHKFTFNIYFEYYRHDGINRIVKYTYCAKPFNVQLLDIDESIQDSITQVLSGNALFECKGTLLLWPNI